MTVWFVSRHQGALDWLQQSGRHVDRVVPHLDIAEIARGDTVLGTLPLHLAAEVCAKGAAFYFLQLPQEAALRGSEYSAEDMTTMGARLRRFEVRAIEDDGNASDGIS